MSAERTSALLLRLYPAEWRRRYGDELDALIVESSAGHVSWLTRLDVALGAVREHARVLLGQGGSGNARGRARSGLLAVLWGWLLVVVGGATVGKTSEHWQSAVPLAHRNFPADAYAALEAAAVAGSAAIVLGTALYLPALARMIRRERFGKNGRVAALAGVVTVALAGSFAGLASWSRSLTAAQRNGSDARYTAAFLVVALLAIACLAAWAFLASRLARELELPTWLLHAEIWLSAAATAAMLAITAATFVWWTEVAADAPHYLGSGGTPPKLIGAAVSMLAGTVLATTGARQALRSRRHLDPRDMRPQS